MWFGVIWFVRFLHDITRPEPEVRFQEFGDNALVFSLLFWVDAAKTRRERVASDLRFMIVRALNEAGVAVAFPQRDVHFHSTQPLKVEVSSSRGQNETGNTDK